VLLADAAARVIRASEALADGDRDLAEHLLDDLGHDLVRSAQTAGMEV
jgi:hypothetical protein